MISKNVQAKSIGTVKSVVLRTMTINWPGQVPQVIEDTDPHVSAVFSELDENGNQVRQKELSVKVTSLPAGIATALDQISNRLVAEFLSHFGYTEEPEQ